jgi:hypothetical protein
MRKVIARTLQGAGVALLILLLAAVGVRVSAVQRWRTFTPIAQHFLETAIRADSAQLAALSADSIPVHWALLVGRQQPALLQASARSLSIAWGGRVGDTVVVEYAIDFPVCSPYNGSDHLQFSFVPDAARWRVWDVGVPPC